MWNSVIRNAFQKIGPNIGQEDGSIILETALILPVFVCLLLAITNFINLATIYLAMDHAVGETVRQMAAHTSAYRYVDENLSAFGSMEPLVRQSAGPAVDVLVQTAIRTKIKSYYPLSKLQDKDFTLTNIKVNEEIAVTVVYRTRLAVPFFSREITMANTAVERAW